MNPIDYILEHKKPVSAFLILGGTGLIMEHLFAYGGFDLLDFWGHEYLGAFFVIVGLFLSTKWHQWDTLELKKLKNWRR